MYLKHCVSIITLALSSAALVACGDDSSSGTGTDAGGSGGTDAGGNGGSGGEDDASSSSSSSTGGTDTGGSGGSGGSESVGMNIVEVASSDDRFDTLVEAVVAAGLDDDLAGEGPFTVFAPTDDAFELLPEGLIDSFDEDALAEVLLYHVVEGRVEAADVVELSMATTLQGDDVNIGVIGETVVLNGLVQVTVTDIEAENGVIHVIDSVLVPGAFPGSILEAVTSYPRLGTLAEAVTEDVVDALEGDDITLFAPVNDAFEGVGLPEDSADLEDVLLYHAVLARVPAEDAVLLKSAQMANGAFIGVQVDDGVQLFDGSKNTNVIYTDIETDNGVIHLIDDVLIPPGTIAEIAVAAELTELVDALSAADVPGTETNFVDAASGDGPLTVFAPVNTAFQALPASLGDDLADVLGAHVIPGALDSAAVVAAIEEGEASPATLTGASDNTLSFSLGGSGPLINSMVGIMTTDIPARNGIVHLVDSVILPSDVTFPGNLVEAVSAYPNFSSLVDAVVNADSAVADALSGAGPLTLFAPTNDAFGDTDTSENLTSVLLYHALPVEADSAFVVSNFVPAASAETALGSDVTIDGEGLMVNDTNIVRVDLQAENGVIHVIDGVLSPEE